MSQFQLCEVQPSFQGLSLGRGLQLSAFSSPPTPTPFWTGPVSLSLRTTFLVETSMWPSTEPKTPRASPRHSLSAVRADERPAELEYQFVAFPLQDLKHLLLFCICSLATDPMVVWWARSCRKALASQLLLRLDVCAAGCCWFLFSQSKPSTLLQ